MAWDEGLAQLLRDDLGAERVTEKRMFGGLIFMLNGNMLCGIHSDGVMFRVGKANAAEAGALPGVVPMQMSGRVMAGWVTVPDGIVAEDTLRATLMALALGFVRGLPPK